MTLFKALETALQSNDKTGIHLLDCLIADVKGQTRMILGIEKDQLDEGEEKEIRKWKIKQK